jgi:hypothetical protein
MMYTANEAAIRQICTAETPKVGEGYSNDWPDHNGPDMSEFDVVLEALGKRGWVFDWFAVETPYGFRKTGNALAYQEGKGVITIEESVWAGHAMRGFIAYGEFAGADLAEAESGSSASVHT